MGVKICQPQLLPQAAGAVMSEAVTEDLGPSLGCKHSAMEKTHSNKLLSERTGCFITARGSMHS